MPTALLKTEVVPVSAPPFPPPSRETPTLCYPSAPVPRPAPPRPSRPAAALPNAGGDVIGRLLRIGLLAWTAFFFVLFVPLHCRGVVALPGASSAADGNAPYCPLCTLFGTDGSGERPPADAPAGCAVCHLKSNLELPAAWAPPPALAADLDFLLPPAAPARAAAAPTPRTRRDRGPPAA